MGTICVFTLACGSVLYIPHTWADTIRIISRLGLDEVEAEIVSASNYLGSNKYQPQQEIRLPVRDREVLVQALAQVSH